MVLLVGNSKRTRQAPFVLAWKMMEPPRRKCSSTWWTIQNVWILWAFGLLARWGQDLWRFGVKKGMEEQACAQLLTYKFFDSWNFLGSPQSYIIIPLKLKKMPKPSKKAKACQKSWKNQAAFFREGIATLRNGVFPFEWQAVSRWLAPRALCAWRLGKVVVCLTLPGAMATSSLLGVPRLRRRRSGRRRDLESTGKTSVDEKAEVH